MSGPCPIGIAKGAPTREACIFLREVDNKHLCGQVLDAKTEEERTEVLRRLKAGAGCAKPHSQTRLARLEDMRARQYEERNGASAGNSSPRDENDG
jgi:hypothetical protein